MKEKSDSLEKSNEALRLQVRRLQQVIDITTRSRSTKEGDIELQKIKHLILSSESGSNRSEEVSKLRLELTNERRLREDLEKQLQEINEEITHQYIDAEVISTISH